MDTTHISTPSENRDQVQAYQAARNRQRRTANEQRRTQNMSQAENNARLERRHMSQRLRRSIAPPNHLGAPHPIQFPNRSQEQRQHTLANRRTNFRQSPMDVQAAFRRTCQTSTLNHSNISPLDNSSRSNNQIVGTSSVTPLRRYVTRNSIREQGSSSNHSSITEGTNNEVVGTSSVTPLRRYVTRSSIRAQGSSSNHSNFRDGGNNEGTHAQSLYQSGDSSTHAVESEGMSCDVPRHANVVHNVRPARIFRGCGRNFTENQGVQRLHLKHKPPCSHCNAMLFQNETSSICCNGGTIELESITTPNEMFDLFSDQTALGRHFRDHIRAYNHVFSFTSMGVHLDENSQSHSLFTFRAQGSIYHRIGNLLPNSQERPRFLQLYIFDTEHEIDNRMVENRGVRRELIERISVIVNSYNPFVHNFRHMAQRPNLNDCKLKIKEQTCNRRQYDRLSASDVAAIIVGGENLGAVRDMNIVVQPIGGPLQHIEDTVGYYDPLQYPLLLPHVTYGWSPNCRTKDGRKITPCDFYSYYLQIRPHDRSILLRAGRLLLQYVVDMYVKIESNRLRWARLNQDIIRIDSYKGGRSKIVHKTVHTDPGLI